jgi:hypothetical protein
MIIRAWTLMLAVSVCLAVPGCGDDDSGGDGDNDSGSGGSGGSGGRSGASGSGSVNAGSGSGNTGSIADCMVEEMMGGSTADCEGIDEYSECLQDMCLQSCMSQCQEYYDCVEDAADPCMPTGCQPSSGCTSCLAGATGCFSGCFELLMCGETTPGGACDQLDDCCAEQTDEMLMGLCEQAAASSRGVGGDMLCMTVMQSLCM